MDARNFIAPVYRTNDISNERSEPTVRNRTRSTGNKSLAGLGQGICPRRTSPGVSHPEENRFRFEISREITNGEQGGRWSVATISRTTSSRVGSIESNRSCPRVVRKYVHQGYQPSPTHKRAHINTLHWPLSRVQRRERK